MASALADEYWVELSEAVCDFARNVFTFFQDLSAKREVYRAAIVAKTEPRLRQLRTEVMSSIQELQEQTPIGHTFDTVDLMRTFVWAAVMALVASWGASIENVLHLLAGAFLTKLYAFGVAYAVLPCLALYCVANPELREAISKESDKYRRHRILGIAFIQMKKVPSSDAVFHFAHRLENPKPFRRSRAKLMVVTLGAGFALHMLSGGIRGFSIAYILLSLLYTAVGLTVLQLYVKYREHSSVMMHVCQLLYVYLALLVELFLSFLFGLSPEDLEYASSTFRYYTSSDDSGDTEPAA